MLDLAGLPDLLRERLPAHVARQRWAGLHGREVTTVDLVWMEEVDTGGPLLLWALVDAELSDGAQVRYQLLIGGRPAVPAPPFLTGKDRQLLGVMPGPLGDVVLYDALVDPDLAIAVLHLTSPGRQVSVRRPLVLEHSNSSVVFDESIILKVFRKVGTGPNADVEISKQLADHGCALVLRPLAELRRDGTHLAVLRTYVAAAAEGWQLARTSVRDLLGAQLPPEECGGDLAPSSVLLGQAIAQLHLAMAEVWGAHAGSAQAWVEEMEADLAAVVSSSAALGAAGFDEAAVRVHLAAARSLDDGGAEIRIHGDLHLAQVLRAETGWLVIDFEGEPARRSAGAATRSSPLRDVAGILRSFHYAAASGLAEWNVADDELRRLVAAWEDRNRQAFLTGYFRCAGIDALLPSAPVARATLLAAFELDKAVYEVGYELAHRPDNVSIPLAGIDRLVHGPVPT